MSKWFWWAPVLTFTAFVVLVRWVVAEPVPARKPIAQPVAAASTRAQQQRLIARPASTAPVRTLGQTVTAHMRNPEGFAFVPQSKVYSQQPPQMDDDGDVYANAIGDVTGDGRDDLVSLSVETPLDPGDLVSNRIFIYEQKPDGTLKMPARAIRYRPTHNPRFSMSAEAWLLLNDLDHDGDLDFIVSGASPGLFVVKNDAIANYPATSYTVPGGARVLLLLDANRDGFTDAVTHSPNGKSLFLGDGAGGFLPATPLSMSGNAFDGKAVDLNGDGYEDLLFVLSGLPSESIPAKLAIYLNDGTTQFAPVQTFDLPLVDSPNGVAAGDFDSDGVKEIAVGMNGNMPSSVVQIVKRDATGNWVRSTRIPALDIPNTLIARDVDGDGRVDLAVEHSGWGAVTIYSGGDWANGVDWGWYGYSPHNMHGMSLGDLNGDGCIDAAFPDQYASERVLYALRCHSKKRFLATDSGWKQTVAKPGTP
ncbi:FG-GAP repeat domain-containing protein [Lysobacter sp. 2RAF19]